MDCVVAAGGRPEPDEPLYAYTRGKAKVLIDINGRSMLERVIDALQASRYVDDVIVVGLEDEIYESGLSFRRPVVHLPDQNNLVDNVLAGINWVKEHRPEATELLISSADIPAVTGPIIDDFVESCRPFNHIIYYNLITKETMEKRFPGSKRTFVPLKDLRVAGGDVVLVQPGIAESNHELWEALANARKHAWKLARIVGLGTLLKFLLRQLTLADIEATAERLLGRSAKIILSPHAELGMDVDKPDQVEILRANLAQPHLSL